MQIIITKSADEKHLVGKNYAKKNIRTNDIIGLYGPLGSGKTVFTKGIASYFNVKDIVNSPTFIISNEYKGIDPINNKEVTIIHFDFYRINKTDELYSIGFQEYFDRENSIFIIEWPELSEKFIGKKIKKVEFLYGKTKNQRIIKY